VEEIATATLREYDRGAPVSREIPLTKGGTLDDLLAQCNGDHFVKTGKKPLGDAPSAEKSFQIRLQLTSGEARTLYIYSSRGHEYIEEPYEGIYKGKVARRQRSLYDRLTEDGVFLDARNISYLYISLSDAFLGDASVLPEYNGAEKAVWIEFMQGGGRSPAKENPLWRPSHYIPEARIAQRAEDVRYMVMYTITANYDGYWYDPRTGERLSDSYNNDYRLTIYDRVDKEYTNLGAVADAEAALEKYFSQLK
jgi:hypothetical protein